ncbi:Ig-like domain-containing protein [Aerococcus urinae]|uniref:Ig-like domain-containing protein n=1 Tax=Aerococcus urinae TaxID=1376 RepID=UPI00227C6F39|nr:YPDG domain-containing protein [Aerococcus urinae]MCY3032518.1 YPDG domain-containing protein [Aerococcus urinae]
MVGKNNYQVKKEKQSNKFYRYSIKRLSVGVASVAVAAGLLFAGDAVVVQAAAEEANTSEEVSTPVGEIEPSKEEAAPVREEAPVVEEPASTEAPAVGEEAPAETPAESEEVPAVSEAAAEENTSEEEAAAQPTDKEEGKASPVTYAAEASDTETPAEDKSGEDRANNQKKVDAIDADAIANGYIKSATDMSNAANTLSGRAWIADKGVPSTMANGLTEVAEGTDVYMQWIDTDGSVSPLYRAQTTNQLSQVDGSQAGPGSFAFDLRDAWIDANGVEHKYSAKGDQYYRLWIPDYFDPDTGNRVTMFRQAGGFFPGSFVGSATNKNLGQFPLLGTNMQRTGIFMIEQGGAYMHRPESEWVEDPEGPINNPAVLRRSDNSVSGRVWLETGAGDYANSATGPNNNSRDVEAAGYKVVASYLSKEGSAAYESAVNSLPQNQRAKAAEDFLLNNPDAIQETKYAYTNEDGRYSIRFDNKNMDENNTEYMYMQIFDRDGNLVNAYNGFTTPVFRSPAENQSFVPQAVPGSETAGYVRGPYGWYNVNHAVVPNVVIDLEITNFNDTDKPAGLNDTAKADLRGAQLPPAGFNNKIVWYNEEGDVLKETPVNQLVAGTDDTYDLPKTIEEAQQLKLRDGEIIRAVFESGGNQLAADSFIVKYKDANLHQPSYKETAVDFGQEAKVDAPSFVKLADDGTEAPVETNEVPLSKDPAKPAFTITTPTRGASIDPNTGAITIPASETSKTPGETIEVPVTVTYEDGSQDQVTAPVKVSAPDVIDRTGKEDEATPEGYHRVTLTAGEGVNDFGKKAYDVKDQAQLSNENIPSLTAKENYENPQWNEDPSQVITGPKDFVATATPVTPADTTAPTITVSAKDIQATEGQPIDPVSVETDDPEATVTVDGLPDGLSYNPETKQIEGTVPAGTVDWADDQDESRDFPATVKAVDPSGNEATEPIKVTVLRDTDGDGQADKTDEDDDNDGIPDKDDDASKVWDGLDAQTTDVTATNGQEVPANTQVVTPNKAGAKVTTPVPVDGLSVDEDGNLVGTPTVDFQAGEKEKVVEIPVEITSTGTGQKDAQGQPTDEAIQRTVKVTVTNPNAEEAPAETSVEVTPKSQNALEGKDITPVTPQADNVPEGGSVKVTIDGQDNYPGLTVDPETGQVTGQPEITDWTPEEETRTITVEVSVLDKDGQPVRDADGNPVTAESTITVYRDTDKDGQPDKDTGMPEDPNNPTVPGIDQGDKDDDNDGWTDQEEKDRGTDSKDEDSFPRVTEPGAENEPGKDTTTVTGKTTPNTDVEVKDKDGNTIGTGTSDDQGNVKIDVPKQNPGDKVTIIPGKKDDQGNFTPVKDDQGNPQGGAETVVKETPQITNPGAKNEPGSDKTTVTGKTSVPNSKVEVKDKDGKTIGTGNSDENGDFTIEVPRQEGGDKVSVIPSKDYTNPDGSTETRTGDPVETTVTEDAPAVVSVEVTPKSQNALEGKDITPVTPQADNVPEGGSVKVTIDGQNNYPGLTVDPETGQVTGSPEITDWAPEEETRTITVEVSVLDKDGKPIADADGNPVTAESTITVYRDTDKDGLPDKDSGMPEDPNNPNVPGIDQGDKDDDNDGWTDQEEKDRGTDSKDEDSFPRVTEPGAENQPGKDTTTVTGKTTPNTDVEVKDKDGNTIGTGKSDEDGNIKIDVPKQNPGDKISIVPGKKNDQGNFKPVTDDQGNPQGGAETVVKETPQITNPGAKNEPGSDKTTVTGKTTVPNTTIEVKDKDGNTIGTGTSDDNGDFTIEVPRQGTGDSITIFPSKDYTNPDGSVETRTGTPVETTVTGHTPASKQDKDIYEPEYKPGTGQPGTKVKVGEPIFKDEDGKEVNPPAGTSFQPGAGENGITVDPETGAVVVEVPADAKPGDKIDKSVIVTYPDGSSETVTVSVTVEEKAGSGVTPVPTPQPEPQPEEKPEVEDEATPDQEPEADVDPVKADDKTVSVKTQDHTADDNSKTQSAPAKAHSQLPQTGAVAGYASSLALALIGAGSILALGKKKKED